MDLYSPISPLVREERASLSPGDSVSRKLMSAFCNDLQSFCTVGPSRVTWRKLTESEFMSPSPGHGWGMWGSRKRAEKNSWGPLCSKMQARGGDIGTLDIGSGIFSSLSLSVVVTNWHHSYISHLSLGRVKTEKVLFNVKRIKWIISTILGKSYKTNLPQRQQHNC